jgi:adenine phosphoribosyltransferase
VNIKFFIREIPDWPKAGVNFKDITPLLENKEAFKYVIDKLAGQFENEKPDKVVGIDARGFLLAAPVAYKLGCGLSIIRKQGKLPYKTIGRDYSLEYASNIIEMHEDTIKKGEKAVLIDDVLATGGTARAAVDLIEKLGGEVAGIGFLIDLTFLNGKEKLKDYKIYSLIGY